MKNIFFILALLIFTCSFKVFSGSCSSEDIKAYWFKVEKDSILMEYKNEYFKFGSVLYIYGAVPAENFSVFVEAFEKSYLVYSDSMNVTGDKISKGKIVLNGNLFRAEVPVDDNIARPSKIKIKIRSGKAGTDKEINCVYYKIYGRMTDFNGSPFRGIFSVGPDEFTSSITVKTDSTGFYSMMLPAREYNIFYADNETYKTRSLENWGWRMIVDRDEEINFKIGTGEVYNLQVWPNNGGAGTYLISFRSMILEDVKKLLPVEEEKLFGEKKFRVTDIAADLTEKDFTVKFNDIETEVLLVQKYYEVTGSNNSLMPAYLVQVDRKKIEGLTGKITVCVEYDRVYQKGEETGRACSRGYTQFYPNFSGLSKVK